jgi:hypothetical protein
MRQSEHQSYFELKGIQLCSCDDGRWFYWQVNIVPGFVEASTTDTIEEAISQIEESVTRLRAKFQEFGT